MTTTNQAADPITIKVPVPVTATPIYGGLHIKARADGMCIDVMRMLYNYRIVVSTPDHVNVLAGFCYFGHGVDATGRPRTMETAALAALAAAAVWDGYGEPDGHDKRAL